jgi:hypothetical protein
MHWTYGSSWGLVYAVIHESVRRPLVSGVALATTVTATDYTLLPAMDIYDKPWEYDVKTIAKDFGNHLVHGFAVAGAYRLLDKLLSRAQPG